MIIKIKPKKTKINCLIKTEVFPSDALYRKKSPSIDSRVIEIIR